MAQSYCDALFQDERQRFVTFNTDPAAIDQEEGGGVGWTNTA
jgi:hypothetical protein